MPGPKRPDQGRTGRATSDTAIAGALAAHPSATFILKKSSDRKRVNWTHQLVTNMRNVNVGNPLSTENSELLPSRLVGEPVTEVSVSMFIPWNLGKSHAQDKRFGPIL